ncbi:MAG: hypothetical protein ACO26G_05585 [Rickettsiales bacterium]
MSDINNKKFTNIENFAKKLMSDGFEINNSYDSQTIKETDKYQSILNNQQIRKGEQEYAMKSDIYRWVKKIINCYLFFVFSIIAFKAFSLNFGLTPPEIIAILTSTTATIIGLPYLIVSSLFSKSENQKNDKTSSIIERKIKND